MKCSLLLLLLPFFSIAGRLGEEVEKKISRQFNIKTNGNLSIDNRYGNIDIAIGESNHITMDVVITVKAGSVKRAQEGLDRISVGFEEGMNRVEATTEIASNSGWSSWFESGSVDMKINYHVMVPADIYLELVNKYGDIYVETTDRNLRIDLSYGDIRLGDVNAKLSLDMAYSDGALSRIMDGELSLSYSDLDMEDANSIEIDMKYTDLTMGSAIHAEVVSSYSDLRGNDVDELEYSGKYDDLVFERVKTIKAESGYSGMQIGGLSTSGDFDLRYGDLRIGDIGREFTRLDINTSYTGVVLEFVEGTSFTIDAENNYCDINHHGLKVMEDIQKSGSTILKASKGTGGAQVLVRMNYGELNIQ